MGSYESPVFIRLYKYSIWMLIVPTLSMMVSFASYYCHFGLFFVLIFVYYDS